MAKPKLALIPSAQGSKFYSVLPSSGVGDFNFSRSGSATRINSQGLIESVANGVSRLNYPMIDGVVKGCPHHILEPQRTNLFPYSNSFTNWSKSNGALISSNVIISPDGTLNADKLRVGVTNSSPFILKNTSVIATETYTQTIYAKSGDADILQITGSTGFASYFQNYNLSNGTLGNNNIDDSTTKASIEYVGNGWYRCIYTTVGGLTTPSGRIAFAIVSEGSGRLSGSGLVANTGLYIYGAQLEQGSYATSYIPTNGSTVTRSAETANGSSDAATFNDSEGVLMAEISALVNDNNFKAISVSESNVDNRITLSLYQGSLYAYIADGGVGQFNVSQSFGSVLEFHKTAIKYKANDCAFWIDGFEVAINTSPTTMPSGLKELAFDKGNGADDFYGNTKQVQYYDSILTDNELETLTSWVSFQDMAEGQLYTIE
jgi:hypothetical protein